MRRVMIESGTGGSDPALVGALPRLGQSETLAAFAAPLISDAAPWVTTLVIGACRARSTSQMKG